MLLDIIKNRERGLKGPASPKAIHLRNRARANACKERGELQAERFARG